MNPASPSDRYAATLVGQISAPSNAIFGGTTVFIPDSKINARQLLRKRKTPVTSSDFFCLMASEHYREPAVRRP